MRRAAKRDASEPSIVKVLRALNASVEFLSGEDIPDLLVGYRGQTHLAECKTPGARATGRKMRETKAGQDDFAKTWRGAPVARLRTPQEAQDWLLSLASAQVALREPRGPVVAPVEPGCAWSDVWDRGQGSSREGGT